MGREEKKWPPGAEEKGWREREGQRQIFDRDTGGLIVGFDLLVNLHCLWKAAESMMRKPLTPQQIGNEW